MRVTRFPLYRPAAGTFVRGTFAMRLLGSWLPNASGAPGAPGAKASSRYSSPNGRNPLTHSNTAATAGSSRRAWGHTR